MLIFDQIKTDDVKLRFLAGIVLCGMLVLFGGLWWVQVVSSRYYQGKLETQSLRTVRIPAVRGNILDRDGRPLAENRPSYNIDLYLEDLGEKFQASYASVLNVTKKQRALQMADAEKKLQRKLTAQEKKEFALTLDIRNEIQQQTRYSVSSSIVADLGTRLQMSIPLDPKEFERRYLKAREVPLPVLADLGPAEIARFEEQSMHTPGLDLDIQSLRYYPNGTVAAHLLGYLVRNNDADDTEQTFSYRLPDYQGRTGIEGLFDTELRGVAGVKSVRVNYLGYRQSANIWAPAEPGENVYLTIDLDIQAAAENALQHAQAEVKGAVVVMDARNGDILALASAPTYDPNFFMQRGDPAKWEQEKARWGDMDLRPQINRAMQENYAPGSIFKIVVGLAALEQGVLDPKEPFTSLGYIMVGKRRIGDRAGAGIYDFDRALARSSNPYFITQGLKPGVLPKVLALGERLHLGEKTDLLPGQETRGHFPDQTEISDPEWRDGDTANLSIGQGAIAVTPLQMAVMTAAVANGGKVLWPRLVSRIEPYDTTDPSQTFEEGRVRDYLGVSARSLRIVHQAMLADVESSDGTGHSAAVPGLHIAGKTGTAEVERNGHIDKSAKNTWFVSFAPEENPRYVVVAMVEGGISGGDTCAPIAHKVYLAIQQRELDRSKKSGSKLGALAEFQ